MFLSTGFNIFLLKKTKIGKAKIGLTPYILPQVFTQCVDREGKMWLLLLLPAWGLYVAGRRAARVDVGRTREEKRAAQVLQPG